MATSTYKPTGYILPSYEDSAMQKLKSIAQPVFDEFKTNGKVDANAIKQLAETQNENLTKVVQYFLELVNKQSDTTTDKIKFELQHLAESLTKNLAANNDKTTTTETNLSDKSIEKLKDELKTQFKDQLTEKQQSLITNTQTTDIASIKTHISSEISNVQQYISKQLESLQKNISGLHIRLPKISFSKLNFPSIKSFAEKLKNFKLPKFKFPTFKFPKLKLPKFKFPTFKFPKLKLPKIQSFNKIKTLGSRVKNVASKAKKAVLKPFNVFGSFFKKLAFGSNSSFTFPKLRKFLINIFSFKNVAKWITGFLKKQVKIFQNMIEKIIKPIKKMIFGAIKMLLNGIGRLLFIYLGPIAITAWTILALVTLLVIGAVLLVLWIKNNWKKIVAFVKSLPSRILKFVKWYIKQVWNVIKWLGKMVWKGIRFIFFDMWVMLGKWIWKKLVQFGNWLLTKIKQLGSWLKKTIVDPIANWFRDNVIERIKKTKLYKKLEPFITSIGNFIARIKKAFSAWDSNKSIWENLKNIGKIIKDSIADWWQTSPFKEKYDKYIKPFVDSVNNLVIRIKDIWQKFNWDENKSFIGNLMSFWENIKTAIKDWWKSSPFKMYYDKLVNWLSDLVKPIKDWWENSDLKKKYDQYIQPLVDSLSNLKNAIFDAFSWDSSKGFFENVIGIWDNLKEKISVWWQSSPFKTYYDKLVSWLSDMVKPVRDWWDSLEIGKKISDMFEWIKELPSKILEKVKRIFGKAGELVGNTWDWITNKVSGSKNEKEFTIDDAVEALNKERTRTIEIDVGTIKDILDIVTQISDYLVKTITVKIDSIISTLSNSTNKIQTQQYSIGNKQEVLSNITNQSNTNDLQIEKQQDTNDAKIDNLGIFMSQFATSVKQNFELILQKLDEKPNLLPIPFANTDAGNTALMENMI